MFRLFSIMLLILRSEGRYFINPLTKGSIPRGSISNRIARNVILSGGYCSHSYDSSAASSKIDELIVPSQVDVSLSTENQALIPEDRPNPSQSIVLQSDPYSTPPQIIEQLSKKYSYKFQYCNLPHLSNCEFFFCGTLHVSNTSVNMVKDVIQTIKPNYVVIELCESRIDSILEDNNYIINDNNNQIIEKPQQENNDNDNITLLQILLKSIKDKSIKTLGMGLLTWMQLNAAKLIGTKLGGELPIACYTSYNIQSTVILGDRLYNITIQRIFDKLKLYEKCKMILIILYEIITMNIFKLKDYIQKTDDDSSFIKDELDRFAEYLPAFANVVIHERDEYIAQTLYELGNLVQEKSKGVSGSGVAQKTRIVVVIGAGHLHGVQKNLALTPLSDQRMIEISSSSKHASSWPGKGVLQVVDMKQIVQTMRAMRQGPPSPRF